MRNLFHVSTPPVSNGRRSDRGAGPGGVCRRRSRGSGSQPAKEDAAGTKRLVYVVKRGTAKDLAPVLSRSFKGAECRPSPTRRTTAFSSAPRLRVLAEVVNILGRSTALRRPSSSISGFWKSGTKKLLADKANENVDEKDLTGAVANVGAQVDAMGRKGAVSSVKHLRMRVLEGQAASVLIGENKPFVSGVNMRATGVTARSVMYRNLGVQAEVSVRVTGGKVATVDLKLEDSHAFVPEDGVSIGKDEDGKPIYAANT